MTIIDERIYLLHQTAKEFLVRNEQEIHRESVHGYPKWKNSLRPQDSQRVLAEACKFCFSLRTIEMRFIDDGSIGEAPKTKKKELEGMYVQMLGTDPQLKFKVRPYLPNAK